jgi:hypothetical protein
MRRRHIVTPLRGLAAPVVRDIDGRPSSQQRSTRGPDPDSALSCFSARPDRSTTCRCLTVGLVHASETGLCARPPARGIYDSNPARRALEASEERDLGDVQRALTQHVSPEFSSPFVQ